MLKLDSLPADLEIVTERLRLVPVSMAYAEPIFAEFTPEITTYMYPAAPAQIEETEAYIRNTIQRREAGTDLFVAILDKRTGEFLGNAGVHDLDTAHPALGIWLKASAHGKRYGVEAIGALIDWARQNVEFDHIAYAVDRLNIPSRRIPEAFGGAIGREYKQTALSGTELDLVEYWIY